MVPFSSDAAGFCARVVMSNVTRYILRTNTFTSLTKRAQLSKQTATPKYESEKQISDGRLNKATGGHQKSAFQTHISVWRFACSVELALLEP